MKAYKNKAQVNNDKSIIIKKNKVVDQVNLIAKIRSDYLKNINEISEIMNDLHDDPQLRHIELNKINVLTDKSLDYASELSHSGNREWYGVIDNIDTINDKIDLVNEIGELIDSYMAETYNIVDSINKSHNNDSLYDILAEDLKKCKDTILKMINSSNVCDKQDAKKNDVGSANACDKQDTNNDKPDTMNDKQDTKNDKPDTKKKDTKKEDKPDNIEKHNNAKPSTFRVIEKIVNRFICNKFMNDKYYVKVDKDKIVFYLIRKPLKSVKMKHMIESSRDVITLAIEKETKTMNEVITICITDNQIKLNIAQTENQNKMNILIIISMMKSYVIFQQ